MPIPHLPNEILDIVCQELSQQNDITTLYRCAISSKHLAEQALDILYRCHSQSPINDEEAEGIGLLAQQELLIQKWAIMWRSIVLSTFGSTMFPYCDYLRTLDLRDLKGLLEEDKFRGRTEKFFFEGKLAPFAKEIGYTLVRQSKPAKRTRLDLQPIVESMADAIIARNNSLEEVSGEFSGHALRRWCPQLPSLQRLHIWDGEILSSDAVREAIIRHCPKFNSLSMHHWVSENSDQHLGSFFLELAPQALRSLQTISQRGVGPETCLALGRHNESLTDLHVVFVEPAISGLSYLKDCRAMVNLSLEIPPSVDLEAVHKDVYDELQAWFGSLTSIKSIHLMDFKSAPTLLTPMLLNDNVQLEELFIDGRRTFYSVQQHRDFHLALTHQKNLHTLFLRGDGEECFRDDIEALVDAMGQLSNLRKLELHGIDDNFSDDAVSRLLSMLPHLEEVYIGGLGLSDVVLEAVGKLEKLRTITFAGITMFTTWGLTRLVEALRASQAGFLIAVDFADAASLIDDGDLALIREQLHAKVGGRLDYIPLRDPNLSEFEGDSD